MKSIIVEIENGNRYEVTLRFSSYKVRCIFPQEKAGWLGHGATNYYTENGDDVYKATRFYTLKNALYGLDNHSDGSQYFLGRQTAAIVAIVFGSIAIGSVVLGAITA